MWRTLPVPVIRETFILRVSKPLSCKADPHRFKISLEELVKNIDSLFVVSFEHNLCLIDYHGIGC